jgi:hypothetical protein
MDIIKLDMMKYLGRAIIVQTKDQPIPIHFKPTRLIDNDTWIGHTDGGCRIEIKRSEIMFVRSN